MIPLIILKFQIHFIFKILNFFLVIQIMNNERNSLKFKSYENDKIIKHDKKSQ